MWIRAGLAGRPVNGCHWGSGVERLPGDAAGGSQARRDTRPASQPASQAGEREGLSQKPTDARPLTHTSAIFTASTDPQGVCVVSEWFYSQVPATPAGESEGNTPGWQSVAERAQVPADPAHLHLCSVVCDSESGRPEESQPQTHTQRGLPTPRCLPEPASLPHTTPDARQPS